MAFPRIFRRQNQESKTMQVFSNNSKSTTNVYTTNPKLSDYTYIYQRDEIFNRIINKLSADVFNVGIDILSEDENFVAQVRDLFLSNNIIEKFEDAYKLSLIYGYAVLYFQSTKKEFKGITVFSPLDIQQIEVNNDKISADYGKIVSYKLSSYFFEGAANLSKDTIKSTETVHLCPDMINNDPRGIPLSMKLYDKIEEKKNIDYSLAQALYKNSTPLRMLVTPPDISEDEFLDAANKFKDINMKTEFVAPEGFDIKSIDNGELPNPEPYVNYYLQTICAGAGVPYAIVISNMSGLSNTRVALKQYMDDLVAIREKTIKPKLIEFIRKLQDKEILPEKDFDIQMEANESIDAIDNSTITYNMARSVSALFEDGIITIDEARRMLGMEEHEQSSSPKEKKTEKSPTKNFEVF